jgi:hypothetical protein
MTHSHEFHWQETLRTVEVRSPFVARVVEEGADGVVLEDSRGIRAILHPSILRDNGLEASGGRLVVPGSIFRHYFGRRAWEIRKHQEARDLRLLRRHMGDILAAAQRVLRTPELAAAYSTAWYTGGIPVGIHTFVTIGTLVEYWLKGDLVQPCPECGKPAYAYHLIGSFMSGRTSAQGVCPACDSAVTFHPWRGPSVGRMTGRMRSESQILEIGQRRPMRLVYPAGLAAPTGPFLSVERVVRSL